VRGAAGASRGRLGTRASPSALECSGGSDAIGSTSSVTLTGASRGRVGTRASPLALGVFGCAWRGRGDVKPTLTRCIVRLSEYAEGAMNGRQAGHLNRLESSLVARSAIGSTCGATFGRAARANRLAPRRARSVDCASRAGCDGLAVRRDAHRAAPANPIGTSIRPRSLVARPRALLRDRDRTRAEIPRHASRRTQQTRSARQTRPKAQLPRPRAPLTASVTPSSSPATRRFDCEDRVVR
jgi:hypothetical protein